MGKDWYYVVTHNGIILVHKKVWHITHQLSSPFNEIEDRVCTVGELELEELGYTKLDKPVYAKDLTLKHRVGPYYYEVVCDTKDIYERFKNLKVVDLDIDKYMTYMDNMTAKWKCVVGWMEYKGFIVSKEVYNTCIR